MIEFANPAEGRYAAITEDGDYTIFDLVDAGSLEIGDQVVGNLNAKAGQEYITNRHGTVTVFVTYFHCTRSVARDWVAGNPDISGGCTTT
jgi:hypothetical protein